MCLPPESPNAEILLSYPLCDDADMNSLTRRSLLKTGDVVELGQSKIIVQVMYYVSHALHLSGFKCLVFAFISFDHSVIDPSKTFASLGQAKNRIFSRLEEISFPVVSYDSEMI
jgi:hypothetical protein